MESEQEKFNSDVIHFMRRNCEAGEKIAEATDRQTIWIVTMSVCICILIFCAGIY